MTGVIVGFLTALCLLTGVTVVALLAQGAFGVALLERGASGSSLSSAVYSIYVTRSFSVLKAAPCLSSLS